MIETDKWPVVQAKWYTAVSPKTPRKVLWVVIHDMEYREVNTAAEDIARYFQNPLNARKEPVKASAHICVDNDSIVQCVADRDVAYAAPGCNQNGIQIELAGLARQTPAEWDDPYSRALLNNAANATAQYCLKFGIPPRRLTNAELRQGRPGIVGHDQASQVFRKSDHTDPGPSFPWVQFVEQVQAFHAARALRVVL